MRRGYPPRASVTHPGRTGTDPDEMARVEIDWASAEVHDGELVVPPDDVAFSTCAR